MKNKTRLLLALTAGVIFLSTLLVYYYVYARDIYTYKFHSGTEIRYEVEYTNRSTMDYSKVFTMKRTSRGAGLGSNAYDTESFIQGELVLCDVADKGDTIATGVSIQKPRANFYVNKQYDKNINATIERVLSTMVFVELGNKGRIQTIWFPNPLKETMLNSIIRTIISLYQLRLGTMKEVEKGEWSTLESDPSGTYESEYLVNRINDKGNLKIRKKKKAYIKNENEDYSEFIISPDIESDCIVEAEFDVKNGILIQLSWTENQILKMAGGAVGYNNTKFYIKHIRSSPLAQEQYAQIKGIYKNKEQDYFPGELLIKPDINAIKTAIYKKNVQGLNLEGLMKQFNNIKIARKTNKNVKTSDLLTLMQSYIYVNPDDAMRIAAYCETAPIGSFEIEMIPMALTATGTREAQLALIHIIKKRSSDDDLCRLLLPSLAIPAKPIPESVDILKTFVSHKDKELSEKTYLILGVLAGKIDSLDENTSKELTDYLTNKLSGAESEDGITLYIAVLGNIRTNRAFSRIKPYLKSHLPGVRACAIGAIKNIKGNESKEAIVKILLNDKNDIVRAKSLEALAARKPDDDIYEIFKTYSYDPSDRVRLRSIEGLWQIRKKYPDSISIIKDVAKADPSEDVRNAANSLLRGM